MNRDQTHRLFDVTGRVALVTGSSRGLGRTLAHTLAQAGAHVILHGRDIGALDAVSAELTEQGTDALGSIQCDVTDRAAVQDAMASVMDQWGTPDILVNNAGLQRRAPIHEFDPDDWDAVIGANLSSAFYVSRFVSPGMVRRGSGKIINVASVQSRLARQTIAPYSASKGGVAQLTAGMAADLARHNIQVNALSPGYFATDMNQALVQDAEFDSWLRQRTPAGRWGAVEELSGALLFLASDASSFVSGQNIVVDGGITAVV